MEESNQDTQATASPANFNIVGLNYVSIYVKDYDAALAFYTKMFGTPENSDPYGWRMGSTWLTLFPGKAGTNPDGNPQNVEYAIQVATPEDVDRLHDALLDAGATKGWAPEDTTMYEPMRFCYVDDPFGTRIDIYCPIATKGD